MGRKRQAKRKRRGEDRSEPRAAALSVRPVSEGAAFELVHPRCVRERELDLEEVRAMLEAGETEIAVDELRWLLDGCDALVEAHLLLGEIALQGGDADLARGHLGYAYELGLAALPEEGLPGPLPFERPANQAFLKAGKALAECLLQLDEQALAGEVARQLLDLDPSDPLGVKGLVPG
jgi:hypothetical protein